MDLKIVSSAVLVITLALAPTTPVGAASSDNSMNQFISQAIKQTFIKKSDSKDAKQVAKSACLLSAGIPENYWPSITKSAVSYEKNVTWPWRKKINSDKMSKLIRLAVDTLCPRSLMLLDVPLDGWQGVDPSPDRTLFRANVTEGALLPLGNAWLLGGSITGYVSSGKWYENAFFTIEMLDANLQPVIANYADDRGVFPNQPLFDDPILRKSTWIGGYSAGSKYSAIGAGSGSENLTSWANAKYARVLSLTGTDNALISLSVATKKWLRTQ